MMKSGIAIILLTGSLVLGCSVSAAAITRQITDSHSSKILSSVMNSNIPSTDDIAYPYIGYLVDARKKELLGSNYRTLLDKNFPNGHWTQYNNSTDEAIDTSIVFDCLTKDHKCFKVEFRFYQPFNREYSTGTIKPYLDGNLNDGKKLLSSFVTRNIR